MRSSSRGHELQNPTSPEKILLLRRGARPGRLLARARHRAGAAADRQCCWRGSSVAASRAWSRGRSSSRPPMSAHTRPGRHLVEVVESKAQDFEIEPGGLDAALCIGATFAFDGLVPTVQALAAAVPSRGAIAAGEPFWRVWPLPRDLELREDEEFLPHRDGRPLRVGRRRARLADRLLAGRLGPVRVAEVAHARASGWRPIPTTRRPRSSGRRGGTSAIVTFAGGAN